MPQRRGTLPISDAEVLGCAETYARGVPYDRLERLRTRTPVVWLDGRLSERPGAWAVLRYSDVQHALARPGLFVPVPDDSVLHGPTIDDAPAEARDGRRADGRRGTTLIDMDPPARAMLDRVPDGEPVDFVADVAADLPETLRNTLAGGLHALLRHPGQYDRLHERRADDRLLDSAVEEMLRWWTPVTQVWRTMRRGTVIGGVPLLAGERVALWLASANRDAEVFAEPERFMADRFVPERPASEHVRGDSARARALRVVRRHQREQRVRPHLCFGYGDRACLGERLARVHLRALLVALLDRPGRARPAGEPVMLRSSARHGFERLPIRWTG
ncbi:cytochrome P450 [Actinomadura rubrisoli]|uniref:Cytochrome P450 n=1 Tax=Actinomadura rubrisoli TaxID=2530368 RepID=A0A4R5A1S1_9ACTN|nr:cytochrome P450 [Actinomadura rubrisoli]TDD65828.1 cytochrome P450 [Actinomadura rubrisoli]